MLRSLAFFERLFGLRRHVPSVPFGDDLVHALSALDPEIKEDDIPAELRAKACSGWISSLRTFLKRGEDPEGSVLSHIDTCKGCQAVVEWGFMQTISQLHELGRRLCDPQKYRLRYQHGKSKPVYISLHSYTDGHLAGFGLRRFTSELEKRGILPKAPVRIWVEPESLPQDDNPSASLREGVIEL